MEKKQIIHEFEVFTIASSDGSTSASFVPARGGVANSIIMPGKTGPRELLYLHDCFWDDVIDDLPGGWPFCFPICGRLERLGKQGCYLYDGKQYELLIHGFSWYLPWQVSDATKDALTLILRDTEETRVRYPFSFEVKLRYQVKRGLLTCHQTYSNLGKKSMPYYAGFHPYFLTPLVNQGKEKVELNFEPLRRLVYNKNFTDIVGEGPLLSLPTSIANPTINEQLALVGKNKEIQLRFPEGETIRMVAEGEEDPHLFSFIQLYTMPDKPFICVEPWMSFPNALNTVSGVRWLAPGQSENGLLKLRYQAS